MDIKTESKTVIEMEAHYQYGSFTTLPCVEGNWWGDDKSEEINFHDEIKKVRYIDGEYKITITLEKINQ